MQSEFVLNVISDASNQSFADQSSFLVFFEFKIANIYSYAEYRQINPSEISMGSQALEEINKLRQSGVNPL